MADIKTRVVLTNFYDLRTINLLLDVQLQLNRANTSDNETSFLDFNINVIHARIQRGDRGSGPPPPPEICQRWGLAWMFDG